MATAIVAPVRVDPLPTGVGRNTPITHDVGTNTDNQSYVYCPKIVTGAVGWVVSWMPGWGHSNPLAEQNRTLAQRIETLTRENSELTTRIAVLRDLLTQNQEWIERLDPAALRRTFGEEALQTAQAFQRAVRELNATEQDAATRVTRLEDVQTRLEALADRVLR